MTKEHFRYLVDIKDFEGYQGSKGLQVTIESDYELSESELANKGMNLMVKEYDKLAHEFDDKNAYSKLMNVSGLGNFREIENTVVSIQREILFECTSEEIE